ncbi:hypothetical protein D3C80_2040210 [compost metagenome]
MSGNIFVGIGGWTFEPWRGTFYPDKLPQKQELSYAATHLSSLEHQCAVKHLLRWCGSPQPRRVQGKPSSSIPDWPIPVILRP